MTEKITIREATIEEALKVFAIIPEFDQHYTKDHFEKTYEGKEILIIAASVNDQLAGALIGYDKFGDGSFYCWMTGVDPIFRRRGVLKALMNYEEKWAKEKGYNKIKIKTRNNLREILAYLIKYGFSFTEVAQHQNIGDNRVHLEKIL